MALKLTVHVVQSFIKGHRKSGVISIKHSSDITHRISPPRVSVTATYHYDGPKMVTNWPNKALQAVPKMECTSS